MYHFIIFSMAPFIGGLTWGVRLGRRRAAEDTPTVNVHLTDTTTRR